MFRRLAAAFALLIAAAPPAHATCPASISVQVLGSGGPDSDDARASAGYLVWIDGQARLLVDAGGGVFLRFGEAKARFDMLDAIAITHLHADPVARNLHARPSEIGMIAGTAGAKALVLSHNMARSLGPSDADLALIRAHYHGPITVAQDLMCFAVPGDAPR